MEAPSVLFLDQSGALGGAELYLLDVARHYRRTSRVLLFEDGPFRERLVDEGIDARVIEAPPGLLSVRREGAGFKTFKAFVGVMRLAARVARMARRYDLLYANSQKALVVGALAGLFARRPVIWNLHDILTADHFSALNRRLSVTFANYLTDRVIVNSRATQRAFAESGGDARKTVIVYNGLDPARFEASSTEQRGAIRERLGLQNTPLVGLFSRLAEWKGQHVLLHALADVPEVHALLVGEALFGEDRRYADALHRQAAQMGVADRVHFLGFRDDVPALMQAVDFVAHTSVAPEPFGRVIVEGMLAKRPVVATRAGGAREIVEHGKTGFLVPPGDSRALAEALRELTANPDRMRAMAHRGYEAARKRFTVANMLEDVDQQLKDYGR